MGNSFLVLLLATLAGCSAPPPAQHERSPCDAGEATYACQVKRYHDVAE